MSEQAALQISADGSIKVLGALTFFTVNAIWQNSQPLFSQATLNFDLSGVTQSDSAGVALLLAWLREARAQNISITLSALPTQMRAIVRVSGLEELLLSDSDACRRH